MKNRWIPNLTSLLQSWQRPLFGHPHVFGDDRPSKPVIVLQTKRAEIVVLQNCQQSERDSAVCTLNFGIPLVWLNRRERARLNTGFFSSKLDSNVIQELTDDNHREDWAVENLLLLSSSIQACKTWGFCSFSTACQLLANGIMGVLDF